MTEEHVYCVSCDTKISLNKYYYHTQSCFPTHLNHLDDQVHNLHKIINDNKNEYLKYISETERIFERTIAQINQEHKQEKEELTQLFQREQIQSPELIQRRLQQQRQEKEEQEKLQREQKRKERDLKKKIIKTQTEKDMIQKSLEQKTQDLDHMKLQLDQQQHALADKLRREVYKYHNLNQQNKQEFEEKNNNLHVLFQETINIQKQDINRLNKKLQHCEQTVQSQTQQIERQNSLQAYFREQIKEQDNELKIIQNKLVRKENLFRTKYNNIQNKLADTLYQQDLLLKEKEDLHQKLHKSITDNQQMEEQSLLLQSTIQSWRQKYLELKREHMPKYKRRGASFKK